MRRRRYEYPVLEACKLGQLRQIWERERDGLLKNCPIEQAEEVAARRIADGAYREWCTLESNVIDDEPSEGEIVLFEWLEKRDWMQLFAPFGVTPRESEERARVLPVQVAKPKPRVLDLVRVQDAYRTGWDIRYNAHVRQALKHRVGAALAFCATKDDAEEVRERLYATYLQESKNILLAPYTHVFPLGGQAEPLRLINEVLLVKRQRPVYVQRCVGTIASYRIFRYPYQRDERFVVASPTLDEQDYRPGYIIEHHEVVVAEIYLLGDSQKLLGLSYFDDPIATVEWDNARQCYQCNAALIGYESLDVLTSVAMQDVVELCLAALERKLSKDQSARQQKKTPKKKKRETKGKRATKTQRSWEDKSLIEPQYVGLSYEQAVTLFIQETSVCERCENALLHGELQEALLDIEPLLVKASPRGSSMLEETFQVGVKYGLKRVGNYCRSCEQRLIRAAGRELLPFVLHLYGKTVTASRD